MTKSPLGLFFLPFITIIIISYNNGQYKKVQIEEGGTI